MGHFFVWVFWTCLICCCLLEIYRLKMMLLINNMERLCQVFLGLVSASQFVNATTMGSSKRKKSSQAQVAQPSMLPLMHMMQNAWDRQITNTDNRDSDNDDNVEMPIEATAGPLSDDLLARIEANRAKAMARRQQRATTRDDDTNVNATDGDGIGVASEEALDREGAEIDMRPDSINCIICRAPLTSDNDTRDAVTALPCAHTFHTHCIQEWADSKRVPLDRACVFKCFLHAMALQPVPLPEDRAASSSSSSSAAPQPIQVGGEIDALVDAALAAA